MLAEPRQCRPVAYTGAVTVNRTTRTVALTIVLGLWTTALEAQSPARRVNIDEALRLFAANNLDLRVARLEAVLA